MKKLYTSSDSIDQLVRECETIEVQRKIVNDKIRVSNLWQFGSDIFTGN